MKSTFVPFCFVGVCIVLAGCGGANYEGPQRFPVSGKVTFNGEPVVKGSIAFLPQAGAAAQEGDAGAQRVSGGAIVDGKYTIPEEKGPNAGKYRIEIHWPKDTGKITKTPYGDEPTLAEAIPDEFNKRSTLTADIDSAQPNLDFDLKSDAKPSARASGGVNPYGPG